MTIDPPANGTADLAPESTDRPPVRLLLVDDEPGLRTAVKAYLEDEGFAVTTANDGE
ncbi:MAG: DNA-binding response regulator, partial [Cyanobacteriota bacterium]|nr:DNA-binding response regulator [Cyanobacteriota bacterium]